MSCGNKRPLSDSTILEMASSIGPRAAGTDGADFKFRQRVDDHYKVMASAKNTLARCGNAQAATAAAAAAHAFLHTLMGKTVDECLLPVFVTVVSGFAAVNGIKLSKTMRSPGSFSQVHSAASCLAFLAASLIAYVETTSFSSYFGLVGALVSFTLSFIALVLGLRGVSALKLAFALQAEKRSKIR